MISMVTTDDRMNAIRALLAGKSYGLTIGDVAQELRINRITAAKYLFASEAQHLIQVRHVGKAKLHYPQPKVQP